MLRGAEEGEIWYLVNPACWRRGIATEFALPQNPAAVRVLEKAGMRKEGLLLKNLKIHGGWKSSYLYAMLAEEWSG